jgi:hypothetical protein
MILYKVIAIILTCEGNSGQGDRFWKNKAQINYCTGARVQ